MTRSQIEYILAVEQYQSFSKASEHCHITQSTLSAMIAKFERQININIFNRKTKPITVTSEGKKVLKQLKNISREMLTFDEMVNNMKGVQTGQLSIACIPTVAPYILPYILNILEKNYPKVNFTIREITTREITDHILSGQIDLGIVSTPLHHAEIKEKPLYNEAFVLYDKRDQKLSNQSQIDINDIDYNRLLLLEEGHCFRNQVMKICNLRQKKTVKSNITYTSGTIESLKNVVSVNKGITLLPLLSIELLSDEERKHIHYFNDPAPAREIGLIYHKNFIKTKLAHQIAALIKNKVGSKMKLQNSVDIVSPF